MSEFYNKYPYTDFHELNLDWVIERVKQLTEDWIETKQDWENTEAEWQELYNYVHDYFADLDVQQEINNKINDMIADGTFVTITTPVIDAKVASMMPSTVASQIGDAVAGQIGNTVAGQLPGVVSDQIGAAVVTPVENWLDLHITQPTTPVVDASLTIPGAAADASATGDNIRSINSNFNTLSTSGFGDPGTTTGINTRILINVDNPVPANMRVGYIRLHSSFSLSATVIIEFATKQDTDYTVYKSESVSIDTIANSDALLNVGMDTEAETYIFINSNTNYLFDVSAVTGQKYMVSTQNTSTFSITNTLNNYEIEYIIYMNEASSVIDAVNNLPVNYSKKNSVDIFAETGVLELAPADSLIEGFYVSYATGDIIASTTFLCTPFIPISANAIIYARGGVNASQIAYYDKDKNYVNGYMCRAADTIPVFNDDSIAYFVWCTQVSEKANVSLKTTMYNMTDFVMVDTTKGILKGVKEAYSLHKNKVMIQPGTYDIMQEYIDEYGASCWDDYSTSYNVTNMGVYGRGIWINGLELYFYPGAKVIAHYTGNNNNVKTFFSPFAIGDSGKIIGAYIDSTELRYSIHPDFNTNTTGSEHILIKDCELHHLRGADWNEAIGSGFGLHSDWVIENCIIHSDGANRVLRIHNVSDPDAQSRAIIKNCYIDGAGYMEFNINGTSTLKSNIIVTGNSWETPAVKGAEAGQTTDNINLIMFNNETRS